MPFGVKDFHESLQTAETKTGTGIRAEALIRTGELLVTETPLVGSSAEEVESILPQHFLKDLCPQNGTPLEKIRANAHFSTTEEIRIFFKITKFNHSCAPNACFFEQENRGCVLAIDNIEPGEEVTISYSLSYLPVAQRQVFLQERFGFQCECLRCTVPQNFPMDNSITELLVDGLTMDQEDDLQQEAEAGLTNLERSDEAAQLANRLMAQHTHAGSHISVSNMSLALAAAAQHAENNEKDDTPPDRPKLPTSSCPPSTHSTPPTIPMGMGNKERREQLWAYLEIWRPQLNTLHWCLYRCRALLIPLMLEAEEYQLAVDLMRDQIVAESVFFPQYHIRTLRYWKIVKDMTKEFESRGQKDRVALFKSCINSFANDTFNRGYAFYYKPHKKLVSETTELVQEPDAVIKAGYICKLGSGAGVFGRKNWKMRWVTLRWNELVYCKTKLEPEPLGRIEISTCKSFQCRNVNKDVHPAAIDTDTWFYILIRYSKEEKETKSNNTFLLRTNNEDAFSSWILSLAQVIGKNDVREKNKATFLAPCDYSKQQIDESKNSSGGNSPTNGKQKKKQ
eukprot:TRINITY_DN93717_c0_g1_i1.p1 TRINITY_DN93717_c0_g1~~TRINITY_DN93717_c0_g1_i1.p1  ORF type:complete len:566 (-),score=39.30 TRINITY_DN93717_c0_g1_i1:98-1795(-)